MNRKCELCGRKEGIVPALSIRRNYNIVLLPRPPYKLVCQYCRAKLNRY